MLHKISLYYFSPTGGTKKAGETFCQEMAGKVEVIDLGGAEADSERTGGRGRRLCCSGVWGQNSQTGDRQDQEASWKRETGGDSGSVRNPCL